MEMMFLLEVSKVLRSDTPPATRLIPCPARLIVALLLEVRYGGGLKVVGRTYKYVPMDASVLAVAAPPDGLALSQR